MFVHQYFPFFSVVLLWFLQQSSLRGAIAALHNETGIVRLMKERKATPCEERAGSLILEEVTDRARLEAADFFLFFFLKKESGFFPSSLSPVSYMSVFSGGEVLPPFVARL